VRPRNRFRHEDDGPYPRPHGPGDGQAPELHGGGYPPGSCEKRPVRPPFLPLEDLFEVRTAPLRRPRGEKECADIEKVEGDVRHKSKKY